jgi:hypothetical protein
MIGLRTRESRIVWQIIRAGGIGILALSLSPASPAQSPYATSPAAQGQEKASPKAVLGDSVEQTFTLVGAGDIASCKAPEGAQATAKLIEQIPGTVFAAGDLAYEKGTAGEFKNCYDLPGDDSKTGRDLPLETTNTSTARPRDIFSIGERRPGQWARVSIATI